MKFSIFLRVFLLLLSSSLAWAQSPLQNHPSEYLAMHATDPVDWHLWTPETRQKAKQYDRLILVSSGYFSCHWCHVTQQELYQDPTVAKRLNELFINIKVDRELTPEIDRQMIDFAKRALGSAGWPQHVIFTPAGVPFAGFTYLPKPQLLNYLATLENTWRSDRPKIEQLANRLQPPPTTQLAAQTASDKAEQTNLYKPTILQSIRDHLDDFSGGMQGSNKFPNSPVLVSLLQQPTLPADLHDWLQLTLQQMQTQHLQDHVYGGFYRYTIDPEWQTPHFEKMLYDNAQLLEIYALAAQKWPSSQFVHTAENTLRYLREHLYDPKLKLYLGSQSALDQTGQEGGDYLWDKASLKHQLSSKQYTIVKNEWQLQRPAPYDLGWHPKPTTQYWREIQQTLQQRATVSAIPTDSKAIIAWNALLLKALIAAETLAQTLPAGEFPYLQQATVYKTELANRLAPIYQSSRIPRAAVWHTKQIRALGSATLEDIAYAIQAFQQLVQDISQHHFKNRPESRPESRPENSAQNGSQNQNQNKRLLDTHHSWQATYQALITQRENFLTPTGWRFTPNSSQTVWHIADNELPSPTRILNCTLSIKTPLKTLPTSKQAWQFASHLNRCK